MRILDKSSIRVSLEDLRMGPTIGPQWQELIRRANGIVLVTGANRFRQNYNPMPLSTR